MSTPSEDATKEYLLRLHEYSEWLITLADSKASILAGGAAVFLALLFGTARPAYASWDGGVLLLGVALVLASVLSSLACLWPRVGRPTDTLLFYQGVARVSLEDYERRVLERTRLDFNRDLAAENHALAGVQRWKYTFLRLATVLLFFGLLFVVFGWALKPI